MTEELKDFGDWFEQIFELKTELDSMRNYDDENCLYEDEWLSLNEKAFEKALEYCNPELVNSHTRVDREGIVWELRDFKYKGFEISNCRKAVAENV